MPISVVMPALEMAQETGKLISWLKKEGEAVAKGEPLLEVETDKAVMEVESPGNGILTGIKVQPGEEVPVGRTIAWILRSGEALPTEDERNPTARKTAATVSEFSTSASPAPVSASQEIKISPKARRLAAERGVDVSSLHGSGPGGEILASDVVAAAQSVPSSVSKTPTALSATARLMAERTTESWTTVPHFFVVREVDGTELKQAREKLAPAIAQSGKVKVTYTDILIALVARVLSQHQRLNSTWTGVAIRSNPEVNISLAVAVEDGVVAPVIHGADKLDLGETARQRSALTDRARAGKLRPADLTGGTFTISNLGTILVDAFSAIITPPQAAVLAIGSIRDRVVPVNGAPGVRPMLTLTLSCDHRVVDGARAAEFLNDLAKAIEKPETHLR
jgi:pyruvate dehydrogenase E2 component (dihydrolipoamide acetyltransferase)